MEEEIVETGSSLDEKEEESDEQKEEEWIIYPCLPSNESNSLSLTLFDCPPCLPKEDECYVHVDPFEISTLGKTCEGFNPTIFKLDKKYVFVDHENHILCDSYIVNFIHDATESYYERGKHGFMHLNNIKFPLFMLKILKLHLFCFPMLVSLCFHDLFLYNIPMHRKWVRLKCVLNLLLDALF